MIHIMLVDDHRAIHDAVKQILKPVADMQLVAQANNGEEAIKLCDEQKPDIILMDLVLPEMDGIETTSRIREKHPEIIILALSSFQEDEDVRAMLANGASGYVLKTSLNKDLVTTIRTLYQGNTVLSPEVAQSLLRSTARKEDFGLTEREKAVLSLMANGLSHAEMAQQLVVSRSTIKFHIGNILQKLGVATRAEAIVQAIKNNLV
jgi:two-component system, NarL family, response regulator LiaR